MDALEGIARIRGFQSEVSASLDQFGGYLRCETCRTVKQLEAGAAGRYTAKGWPSCCGHTMRWWTQQQIDNGEDGGE